MDSMDDKHSFFGKRQFCYTDVTAFTDIQGFGSDPLYKRYNSVESVVKRYIAPQYRHFLATPDYNDDEDTIAWFVDDWKERPVKLSSLSGEEKDRYEKIKQETLDAYRASLNSLEGEDLQIMAGALVGTADEERLYCCDGKIYAIAWGMQPAKQYEGKGSIIHEIESDTKYKISFDAGEHGKLSSKLDRSINRVENSVLSAKDFPEVKADEGWIFDGWEPSLSPDGITVKSDLQFTAKYKQEEKPVPPATPVEPVKPEPEVPVGGGEPPVEPRKRTPWYRRWWQWLTGKGCLKWLLWLLLALVLFFILLFLLRNCHGCSRNEENGVTPIDSISRPDGSVVDDNGRIKPITDNDGKLPDNNNIVAPATGGNGEPIPVIERPGVPDVIANRLFLFMENDNDDVDALARDFKKVYAEDKYAIIGYDKEVKLLVIQIPEQERDHIRQTINAKIPNHKFIVFDEEIYELTGSASTGGVNAGWHLQAIDLQQGWKITRGAGNVKVAVVDDGIEASHPMFKGRIVDAYNVFTQNNSLSMGVGHGTHTAGLAAGCADFYNRGASGVAPGCMLMPVQVFDNGQCPLSALVAGVMYAVHHDADVVNISIGPSFKGLNQLPVAEQNRIARQQFKNVEMLWARVCRLAAKKNTILVFAAGNDDILSSIPPENRNESAIVVAAVDKKRYPTVFTNYGPCSDISAPGKDIYSAYPRGSFKSMDGTSMAAPIVTGTIALMKSLKKDLTVAQARNVLYKTGADVYGFIPPMVLVDKALEGVKRGDFGTPERRPMKPVPDRDGDKSSADNKQPVGSPEASKRDNPVSPVESNETDYDAIRRKIAEYKQKISELEKLLPRKKKNRNEI